VTHLGLPDKVLQFLAANIASVEQLEILLMLRAGHDRSWNSREIYQRVMTNVRSIEQSLKKLCEQEQVRQVSEGQYQFIINTDLERVLEELAAAYKEMPTRILSALYGRPSSEMKAFADAFKIKKPQ
jgi:hypothetical protein